MRHRDALLELISPALARARRERRVRVMHRVPPADAAPRSGGPDAGHPAALTVAARHA
jgi:hypothetical protein